MNNRLTIHHSFEIIITLIERNQIHTGTRQTNASIKHTDQLQTIS